MRLRISLNISEEGFCSRVFAVLLSLNLSLLVKPDVFTDFLELKLFRTRCAQIERTHDLMRAGPVCRIVLQTSELRKDAAQRL